MLNSTEIFLRKVKPSDAEIILKWENDSDNWEVSNTNEKFTKSDIENFVNQEQDISLHNQLRLMICYEDVSVGCVDLFEYNQETKSAGVGILIDEAHRNKHFATQTIESLISYCRNELGIVHLFCNIFKENEHSIRLFENCGFSYVDERVLFEKKVNYYERKC